MTDREQRIIDKLLAGPIPVTLLLHMQDSAAALDHGTIELVFSGGNSIDVKVTERRRFDKA